MTEVMSEIKIAWSNSQCHERASASDGAPASEEPRVESAAGDQKEVQEGYQLWPMEVSRLEETAAEASMEPAVAVEHQQSQHNQ
jgi:hypothetical protein